MPSFYAGNRTAGGPKGREAEQRTRAPSYGAMILLDDSIKKLGVCEIVGCWVHLASMSTCPSCHQPATKRDGYDVAGRQRYHCRPCQRDFTAHSSSAFSGYCWPSDVILMAVRWYCTLPLSAAQVVRLLAERNIDVSARTVLKWVQTFGPQLAAALRKHRLLIGRIWTVDEVFCFRAKQKLYIYRAILRSVSSKWRRARDEELRPSRSLITWML